MFCYYSIIQERNVDVGDVDIDQLILSHKQIMVKKKNQYKKKKQRFKDNTEQPLTMHRLNLTFGLSCNLSK